MSEYKRHKYSDMEIVNSDIIKFNDNELLLEIVEDQFAKVTCYGMLTSTTIDRIYTG